MFDFKAIDADNSKLGELLLTKLAETYYEGSRQIEELGRAALKRSGDIDPETSRQINYIKGGRDAALLQLLQAYFDAKLERFLAHRHEDPGALCTTEGNVRSLVPALSHQNLQQMRG